MPTNLVFAIPHGNADVASKRTDARQVPYAWMLYYFMSSYVSLLIKNAWQESVAKLLRASVSHSYAPYYQTNQCPYWSTAQSPANVCDSSRPHAPNPTPWFGCKVFIGESRAPDDGASSVMSSTRRRRKLCVNTLSVSTGVCCWCCLTITSVTTVATTMGYKM